MVFLRMPHYKICRFIEPQTQAVIHWALSLFFKFPYKYHDRQKDKKFSSILEVTHDKINGNPHF